MKLREDHSALQTHPELASERSYIDRAYQRLEELKANLRENLREAYELERGGTPQARAERDMIVRSTLDRLDRLDFGALALCFGRIDRSGDYEGATERFYIGRIAVAGADMDPLVVDWRAPVAEPFYRATAREPMGITLRRHYESHGGVLVGIEDEPLDVNSPTDTSEVQLAGAGALFFAMEKARTGQMGDIVATIQAEQDDIIRAPLAGVLVVQGGPGTGKTAVALHRAAYLLYTYRNRLEAQGVLVIAPSTKFARYIERVLPSLGETGVEISTVAALVETDAIIVPSTDEEAKLKADRRMVDFLAKAVRDRQRALRRDIGFYLGSIQLWITKEMSRKAVILAKRRPGTHNERQRIVEAFLARQLAKRYIDETHRSRSTSLVSQSSQGTIEDLLGEPSGDIFIDAIDPDETDEDILKEIERSIRAEADFHRIIGRIWPKLTPEQLLVDLYSHQALCVLAGQGILENDEVSLMLSTHQKGVLSRADLALIDEASIYLGPANKKRANDEVKRFGHIVVDEAQEMSYMEARMLSRRSISSSMTLVGDLAQTTSPYGLRSWEKIVEPLTSVISQWSYRQLSVNYRTPSEIAELAYKLCDPGELGLEPSISIRASGFDPIIAEATNFIIADAVSAVEAEILVVESGLIGVIMPESEQLGELREKLSNLNTQSLRIEITNISDAKGLEFDSVIVLRPSELVSDLYSQRSALFTAVTRATKRLTLMYQVDELEKLTRFGLF